MDSKQENSMDTKQENHPHAVCVPFPTQGHITPMLKLAKILHSKGYHITFVNTEFNHRRLLKSRGSAALDGLPSFRFETIPDGLPPPDNPDATQDIPTLCKSTADTCSGPLKDLVAKVSAAYSPVTCIVADFLMSFTVDVAGELELPVVLLWTSGAGSLIVYDYYPLIAAKGFLPVKDPSDLKNGYMDTVVNFIPSMSGMRLRDIPSFIRTTRPDDAYMVQFLVSQVEKAKRSSAILFNTFQELEPDILDTLSSTFPPCYTIGLLHLMESKFFEESLMSMGSNLWVEDHECLKWLDSKEPNSVVYVNFGSITVMTPQELVEFCWGLAKSNQHFLWIIRPDLVTGESAVIPSEFVAETEGRGLLAGWCDQEQVLSHPSIGGFLTHSGWNSMIESISSGVPMICWSFFADQMTNSWLSCIKWGVGMEIGSNVKRDEIKKVVEELMTGEKGKEIRKKVIDWKKKAENATVLPSGSSIHNLEKLLCVLDKSL